MERSERKEILQLYLNNTEIVKKTDNLKRAKTLIENNAIIIRNYDEVEGQGKFAELFNKHAGTMRGSSVEIADIPEEEIELDVYDMLTPISMNDLDEFGMLFDKETEY